MANQTPRILQQQPSCDEGREQQQSGSTDFQDHKPAGRQQQMGEAEEEGKPHSKGER